MKRIDITLAVCLFLFISVTGQNIPREKILFYEKVKSSLDTVTPCSAHVCTVQDDSLVIAFFGALCHYPELCPTNIRLQYGSIRTSMAAQPRLWSLLFRKRSKRKYKVIINQKAHSEQAQLLYAAPFNACIGVMGHELAHITDYSTQSGWQMIWTGIRYLGKKYRRKMERETDSIAIARGFGWQLYNYAYFIIHQADIDEGYRRYKLEYYMKPEEIYEMILQKEEDDMDG
ncbi:MAG: hypothetical protein LBQ60_19435 [Bacteroidales bacterium]|jgi:hypothetical protein|nr:hypothetical protein [Bacteroidales bacterium]